MVALSSFRRQFGNPVCVHRPRSRTPCPQARPEEREIVGGRPQRWCAEVMDVKADKASDSTDLASVNEVRLVGRVSRDPEQRVLPSGDEMWTFLLVVPRPPGGRSKQSVDAIDCVVWGGRVRASVSGWAADDVVEVSGPLRKRFYQGGSGAASRVEVEVTAGRVVRRAATRRAATG